VGGSVLTRGAASPEVWEAGPIRHNRELIETEAGKGRELAVLVTLETDGDWQESLTELERLADTAGAEVADVVLQRRDRPDPATFVGKGKAQEVHEAAAASGADLVIVHGELSPLQQRNLENVVKLPVIDRTGLILDIFAQRARSNEGKLQVELAQLHYTLPRLTGRGVWLSRLGGGIGTRGPGETKLEADRRRVRRRITAVTREVEEIRRHRATQRQARQASMIPTASLIGYTNAGKSTVLNALSGADALVEDKLFATLDPTIRRVALPGGLWILLADTVGFIRNLPHQLVAAFRATFEEVTYSDLLVHVVDASHPQMDEQMAAVERVLAEIGVPEKPIVTAFNKADAVEDVETLQMKARRCVPSVILSALRGTGLDELREALAAQARRRLHRVEVLLPLERGDLVSLAHERGRVEIEHYAAEGIELVAHVPGDLAARLAALDLRAPAPVEEW